MSVGICKGLRSRIARRHGLPARDIGHHDDDCGSLFSIKVTSQGNLIGGMEKGLRMLAFHEALNRSVLLCVQSGSLGVDVDVG